MAVDERISPNLTRIAYVIILKGISDPVVLDGEGRLQERFVIPGCQLQRCLITRLFNSLLEIRAIPSVIVRRHNQHIIKVSFSLKERFLVFLYIKIE